MNGQGMHSTVHLTIAALAALAICAEAAGQSRSDVAREKRWAEQFLPSLMVGDAVELRTEDGIRFIALHTPAGSAKGAALLAHGPGLHPDHGLTGELRVHLSDRGYSTLSLQMPVLRAEVDDGEAYRELFPEAGRRIAAGLRFLQDQGARRIFIVSHAMGAGMSHDYLRRHRDAPVQAWVALSYYGVFDGIAGARFPVFDLYGASDYRGIRGPAQERATILRTLPGSRQLAAPDGGRFLAGAEKTVLREVAAFLDALPK
jgi:hypothetical protein